MDHFIHETTDSTHLDTESDSILHDTMDHFLHDTIDNFLHDTMDHFIHETTNNTHLDIESGSIFHYTGHSQPFEHHALTSGLEHPQSWMENIEWSPPFVPHNYTLPPSTHTTIRNDSLTDPAGYSSDLQIISLPHSTQSFFVGDDSHLGCTSSNYCSVTLGLPGPLEPYENQQVLPSENAVNVSPLNRREDVFPPAMAPKYTDKPQTSVYHQHPEYEIYWFLTCWKAVVINGPRKFVEQTIYQPKSEGDQARYVSLARLQPPIIFFAQDSDEWGVPLRHLLSLSKGKARLAGWNEPAFKSCGPSIAIRLQWPGYPHYHKQVKTNDYRHECRMINKAKLAQIVAKCVREFIEKMSNQAMQVGVDRRWKVGPQGITVNDIILVSLHHVSKGSWQPQLRLSRIV